MINWKIEKSDMVLIGKIIKRVQTECDDAIPLRKVDMDITATHLNGCPLKLTDLLNSDKSDFFHDIFGISLHIDRTTGKLLDCFIPHCAI